jgi:hypothetical protein
MPGVFDNLDLQKYVRAIAKDSQNDGVLMGDIYTNNTPSGNISNNRFPFFMESSVYSLYDDNPLSSNYGSLYLMCGYSIENSIIVDDDRDDATSTIPQTVFFGDISG